MNLSQSLNLRVRKKRLRRRMRIFLRRRRQSRRPLKMVSLKMKLLRQRTMKSQQQTTMNPTISAPMRVILVMELMMVRRVMALLHPSGLHQRRSL